MENQTNIRFSAPLRQSLLRHAMPPAVRHRILARLRDEDRPGPFAVLSNALAMLRPWPAFSGAFAAGVLATAITVGIQIHNSPADSMGQEVISSHVRSLMADHLADIASDDPERVRSWFGGRLDYSPQVRDLRHDGYKLVGGRMDYVAGRPVAAVIYRNGSNVVNVFSCPQSGRTEGDHELERSGFTAMGWTDSSMQYWVVGDGDLRTLVSHLRHFKST